MTDYPRAVRTCRLKPGSVIAGIANRPLQVRKVTHLAPDSGYMTLLCRSKTGDFLQVTRHADRLSVLLGFDASDLDDHGPARDEEQNLSHLGNCEDCEKPMARVSTGRPVPEGRVRFKALGVCARCYHHRRKRQKSA